VAFFGALLPALGEGPLLLCCLATGMIGVDGLIDGGVRTLMLLGEHGVMLQIDPIASWFLLLNALVMVAVRLDQWRDPGRCSPLLPAVLLGGLNTCFVVSDLISLYVALEVVGIAAFLLIQRDGSQRMLWIGLRYLLISNTAMTLYLVGAGLAYAVTGSFRFSSLTALPLGAAEVLLLLGLITKAGLFLPGLWLPRSHAEAPSDVSALLSGVVVTGGAAPLLHLAAVDGSLLPLLRTIGLCSAGLGIIQALTAPDLKRLLAWSTVSQMGLVVLSPITGGAVALAHGLAKATLFLMAGQIQKRQLLGWQERALPLRLQLPLWIGSLSIAGAPLLAGFSAKKDLDASLPEFWAVAATLTSIGSVALFARLWGAPLPTNDTSANRHVPFGSSLLLLAVVVGGLLGVARGLLTPVAAGETALLFAAGLGIHLLLKRPRQQIGAGLPQLESLQDLIGNIAVVGAALLLAVNLMEAGG
jgi:multicomponent Na+:H+ antiporter subunit D